MRPAGQPSLDGRGAGDDDVRSVFDVAYDAMSARCSRCSSHRYWSVPADQMQNQQIHFMKNVAIAGGLLFVFARGARRYAIDRP